MERTKRDFETLVVAQKEQLSRYEKRLKDVVTAYKGLLKEKEALEMSLAAVTAGKESSAVGEVKFVDGVLETADNKNVTKSSREVVTTVAEDQNQLQTQIMTLMNSLATLSAEKSRMEASFQADKKHMRAQLALKDQTNVELQDKLKNIELRTKWNVDEVKAKLILERQEHEKESNNQMLMIRELQKLFSDERHLKENIEMQLNNFKTQFASNEADNSGLRELQAKLKEATDQLKQLGSKDKHPAGEDRVDSAAVLLRHVHQEMQQLKEQHAVAIKSEQRRVLLAEEQSRRQAALHENRVANLEARLAELSNTVGSYDRLREQDQESIQSLKKKLQELDRYSDGTLPSSKDTNSQSVSSMKLSGTSSHDLVEVVDEIIRLKKILVSENTSSLNPIDVSKIFSIGTDHVSCREEIHRLQQQSESGKSESAELLERVQVQKSHISTLQEKVKVLNRNIDEQEIELKQQGEKLRQAVKEECIKWKDAFNELEIECRFKVNELEQQLQKQRQRSLQLLDEKEQEIKTLQTSFEIFQNASAINTTAIAHDINLSNSEFYVAVSSDSESIEGGTPATSLQKKTIKAKKLSVGENCHMLHYANEIARKDIEISGLRKSKYAAETSLRKVIQEKVSAQEELSDKIALLEEHVDRLERCKTREGANLEYLKNVVIKFIITRDVDGKRHMMNAISAVLQFTPTEVHIINAEFQKK